MVTFFFNDCLPKDASDGVLVSAVDLTLREYLALLTLNSGQIDGIVTEKIASEIILNLNSFSLLGCLEKLKGDIKPAAFRIFTKYPIRSFFPDGDDQEILEGEYTLTIKEVNYIAINPAITHLNGGCLFTPNLHSDLAKNLLPLWKTDGQINDILNLYGHKDNTKYVSEFIKKLEALSLGNLHALIHLTNGVLSSKAQKQFKQLVPQIQKVIVDHFDAAIQMSGGINIQQDKELVKVVEVTKCNNSVFELRVFSPVAFRIYFSCKNEKIFITAIERKPSHKVQSIHIKAAKAGIETLFAENNI